MKHLRKCTALLLAVILVLALAACGQKDDTAAVDKDLTCLLYTSPSPRD